MLDDPIKPIISAVVGAALKYGASYITENGDQVAQLELTGMGLMILGALATIISIFKR